MNLISALKQFKKVVRKEWEDEDWFQWSEYMYITYNEDSSCLWVYDQEEGDGSAYEYNFEDLMASDWLAFIECPACRINHDCEKED